MERLHILYNSITRFPARFGICRLAPQAKLVPKFQIQILWPCVPRGATPFNVVIGPG